MPHEIDTEDPSTRAGHSLSIQLYREMLRIRIVEETIAEVYAEQQMRCPVHLCIGQEAVAVGVCSVLSDSDYVFGGHRSHGHYLAKGGDLKAMIAELYGRSSGCSGGKGGSMHLIDQACGFMGAAPIVGSTIAIATGAALASVMKEEDRIVAPFFGEGATEEGAFYESVNFAALRSLPIVYICENNLYSVYSPLEVRQPPSRDLIEIVKAMGMTAAEADGNDVFAVRELAQEAVSRARSGDGPALLQFHTYRWREHCGPNYDNDIGYRTEAEYLEWKSLCPIAKAERRLLQDGVLSERDVEAIRQELSAEAKSAIRFAKESPYPEREVLMRHIYAQPSQPPEPPCGN